MKSTSGFILFAFALLVVIVSATPRRESDRSLSPSEIRALRTIQAILERSRDSPIPRESRRDRGSRRESRREDWDSRREDRESRRENRREDREDREEREERDGGKGTPCFFNPVTCFRH